MLFEQIMFFIAALGAIAGALGVVMLRNPFFSVLALVGHLLSLAVLFLLLHAEFIAAAQVVVYAGAVMVLYVFVVAYIGGVEEPGGRTAIAATRVGPLVAALLLVEITIAVVGTGLSAVDTRGAELPAGYGSPGQIGQLLLQRFLIAFEAASFLLLVAAIAAVVLARRRRGLEEFGDEDLPERAGKAPLGGRGEDEELDLDEATRPPATTAEGPAEQLPTEHAGAPAARS